MHATADGELVVLHDATVDRTTSGTGRVDAMTLDQIKELDAAHWFVPDCGTCAGRPDTEYALRGLRDRGAPDPGRARGVRAERLQDPDAARGPRDVPARAHQHRDQGHRARHRALRARAGGAAGRVRPHRRHDRRVVPGSRDRGVQGPRAAGEHRGRHRPGGRVLDERAGPAARRAEPAPPGAAGADRAQRPDRRHPRVRRAGPRERPGRPCVDDQRPRGRWSGSSTSASTA